jgi:hypothetical protein
MSRLSRQFGVSTPQLRLRLEDLRKQSKRWSVRSDAIEAEGVEERKPQLIEYRFSELSPSEVELIEILVLHTDLVPMAIERIAREHMSSPTSLAVFQLYLDLELDGHALDFQSVLTATEEPALKNILVRIQEQAIIKATKSTMDAHARLESLCERWAIQDGSDPVRSQRDALEDRSLDDQSQIDLLESLIRQAQLKHRIEQP